MTRIPKLPLEEWAPELRDMTRADSATDLERGLMRMFAHAPGLAKGVAMFGGALRTHRTLPNRLVELVRLRVAYHNQCRSCMAIRYRDAVSDGVDEPLVCELEAPATAEHLSEAERAAICYSDRFATDHLAVDDDDFAALREHFSESEIVELAMTVAFARAVSPAAYLMISV